MYDEQTQAVKRPKLYIAVAILSIFMALPLAVLSGQNNAKGLFDECYGENCQNVERVAKLPE